MNIKAEVHKELNALAELIKIPRKAWTALPDKEMRELYDNGMSVSDIADHAIEVANIQ